MTNAATTATATLLDADEAKRLSAGFNRMFERLALEEGLFTDDAFFDLNMPVWRFQLQGPETFAAQLRAINQGGRVWVDVVRTVPSASGFVTEHVEHEDIDGEDHSARRLWLCLVRDGRIAEVVGYCSGEWDDALRARHRREAPMIRP